jgi:signal transduction histidine kinase
MGGTRQRPDARYRHALTFVALLLAVTTSISVADLADVTLVGPRPTLAVALAAVACAALATTGILAVRLNEGGPPLDAAIACIGIALVGIGTVETALRAAPAIDTGAPSTAVTSFAVIAWVGRGLLTVGLTGLGRPIDRALGGIAIAFTGLGIYGASHRGASGMPSDFERLGAGLLAIMLLAIALRWLVNRHDRSSLNGSVALLAAGVALALLLANAAVEVGDAREVGALAWLILTSAIAASWLDKSSNERRLSSDRLAFDAMRSAEEQRVLLESTRLEQSIVRHDSRSSLTAVEGGIQAIVDLHERGDHETLLRMSAVVLAELGRVRRLLEGTPLANTCDLMAVLNPLVALHRAGGVRIDVDLEPSLVPLDMSPDALAQAIENIIRNSEVHAPGADVKIRGRLTVGGDRLILSFQDNGPGIAPELRPVIFEPLTSSRDDGGLGLHTVRSLVTQAGGGAEIEPSFVGTCVRLDLPVRGQTDVVVDLTRWEPARSSVTTSQAS